MDDKDLCCTTQQTADCDTGTGTGPAMSYVNEFIKSDATFLAGYLEAWIMATENGYKGKLTALGSTSSNTNTNTDTNKNDGTTTDDNKNTDTTDNNKNDGTKNNDDTENNDTTTTTDDGTKMNTTTTGNTTNTDVDPAFSTSLVQSLAIPLTSLFTTLYM